MSDSSEHQQQQLLSAEVVLRDSALSKARNKQLSTLWVTTLRRMLKSAMYAALARWAFGLAKSLVKFGGSPQKLLRLLSGELFSANPFKWACVFGVISSYRGVQQTLERAVTATGGNIALGFTLSSLAAGGVSSLGCLAMNSDTRTELSLYLFVRSMHGFLTGVAMPRMPSLLRDFQHWDTFSVCLATFQVFYSLFFQPNSISPKYNTFLRQCTMQDSRVFESLAGVYRGIVVPEMIEYCKAKGVPMPPAVSTITAANPLKMSELHKYFHPPGTPCRHATLTFLRNHFFGFSMKLYLPLKLSTTLIFGWKKCLKEPWTQTKKVLTASVRSSLFLTGYVGGAWPLICIFSNLGIRSPVAICAAGGTMAGLSTLWEPKARRADLALYIMMNAVRGFYNLLAIRGFINPATMRHITALSIGSMACMFLQLETQPDQLHPNVAGSLLAMIGESPSSSTTASSSLSAKKSKNSTPESEDSSEEATVEEAQAQASRQQPLQDF